MSMQVCSYWHDHPTGDPSFDDCESAATVERARARPVSTMTLDPWGRNLSEYVSVYRKARDPMVRYHMACAILDWHTGAGSHPNTLRAWRNHVRSALLMGRLAYP